MLEWLPAYETEEECNKAYKETYPEKFDSDGNYRVTHNKGLRR
jgi:hypothetical protein